MCIVAQRDHARYTDTWLHALRTSCSPHCQDCDTGHPKKVPNPNGPCSACNISRRRANFRPPWQIYPVIGKGSPEWLWLQFHHVIAYSCVTRGSGFDAYRCYSTDANILSLSRPVPIQLYQSQRKLGFSSTSCCAIRNFNLEQLREFLRGNAEASTMSNKRIVFCCDGTSNTAFSSLDVSPHTNVYRIWRYTTTSAKNGVTQMKFYQSGLGTAPGSLQSWNQALAIGLCFSSFLNCLSYATRDGVWTLKLLGFCDP